MNIIKIPHALMREVDFVIQHIDDEVTVESELDRLLTRFHVDLTADDLWQIYVDYHNGNKTVH